MELIRLGIVSLFILLSFGCEGGERTPPPSPTASASAGTTRAPSSYQERLLRAERARDIGLVLPDDLGSRDVARRRKAVSALARSEDVRARETLRAALSDPDPEVVAWAAYGLGRICRGTSSTVAGALVVRAATLPAPAEVPLDPYLAIADALGRCGGPRVSRTLETWLSGPKHLARVAPFGLGRLSARDPLDASTVKAILAAAAKRGAGDAAYILYPLTRALELTPAERVRLDDIAARALERPGIGRGLAIRALVNGGQRADEKLVSIVEDGGASSAERQSAARALSARGDSGQERLAHAADVLSGRLEAGAWEEAEPLLAVLSSLDAAHAPDRLPRVAAVEDEDTLGPAKRRRLALLRCRAAALRAGDSVRRFRRQACEKSAEGRIFMLALVSVLDRARLVGQNRAAWQGVLASRDPVVRQAALRLVASHPELEAKDALFAGLGDANSGTATTAAQIIAAYPMRIGAQTGGVAAKAKAGESKSNAGDAAELLARLVQSDATPLEARAAAMNAAAALQLLGFKPMLEKYCGDQQPMLRKQAEAALRLLGSPDAACDEFEPAKVSSAPPAAVASGTRLEFVTDAGKLGIEVTPDMAPAAAARLVELARRGFFDGMAVHRVVPGFVVQFGDRDGDGFGSSEVPALACETAPVLFEPGAVGVALAGRDTGATQFFVVLGPYPHLSGDYTRVGRANGAWDKLVVGDLIHSVAVTP